MKAKYLFTKKHRKNLSLALMGKVISQETRAKMSTSQFGKKLSEETRKRISLAMVGKKNALGKKKPLRTEEHRKKLSEVKKGKINEATVYVLGTIEGIVLEVFEDIKKVTGGYITLTPEKAILETAAAITEELEEQFEKVFP